MSKYSTHVKQFIDYTLTPEINACNIKLASIEAEGFASATITALRDKLFLLIPVYDFLREYVDGNEECEFDTLTELMSITGLEVLAYTKKTI